MTEQYSGKENLSAMKNAKNMNEFFTNKIVSVINKYKYKNIVDFGCADGYFIKKISEKTDTKIFGIETDKDFINSCKQSNINIYSNIKSIQDNTLDFLYSLHTLEHIENDFDMLKMFYNKIKSDGRIFLCVPSLQFLYCSMDKKVGHFRRYSKNNLEKLIVNAGFQLEDSYYIDCFSVIGKIFYKYLKSSGEISGSSVAFYDTFVFPFSRFLDKMFFKNFFGNNLIITGKKI